VLGLLASPAVALASTAVAGWCFVLAALGLAHRFLDFGNAALRYLSEAAFPVYVLHQAAIVVPGYFLVRLPLGIAAKFTLLVATAVTITFTVYHLLVRPRLRALWHAGAALGRTAVLAAALCLLHACPGSAAGRRRHRSAAGTPRAGRPRWRSPRAVPHCADASLACALHSTRMAALSPTGTTAIRPCARG
jgi:hypothetical protein